jgi:hypothetical protein
MNAQIELLPSPAKAEVAEVEGRDLAAAIGALEQKGHAVDAVDLVGQSRYALHHRPRRKKWRTPAGAHCVAGRNSGTEIAGRMDGTPSAFSPRPLGNPNQMP